MASSETYLEFLLEQLSELNNITYRRMMGEYILYYNGKIVGGIYDDRLLLKPTDSLVRLIPEAKSELPYDGAKPMLLIEDVEDRELLNKLFDAVLSDILKS